MEVKDKVLATMKEAGQPLNAGKIAELSGLDRKEVDKAMKQLKAEGRNRLSRSLQMGACRVRNAMDCCLRLSQAAVHQRLHDAMKELLLVFIGGGSEVCYATCLENA